jgi:acetoin utilization protein AcuB
MIAEQLVNQTIPPLKSRDSLEKALQWMEVLKIKTLPVMQKGLFKGFIAEEMIYQNGKDLFLIKDLDLIAVEAIVPYDQHYLEILRIANKYEVEMVAVSGEYEDFIGVVTTADLVKALSNTSALQESGGIVVLKIKQRDYSMTEISRLVESNNAKILSTNINQDENDAEYMYVTLKINKSDLSRTISTFERFGYFVSASYQTDEKYELDKSRLDMLLKYLDI